MIKSAVLNTFAKIFLMFALVFISVPGWANSSDWGQVNRFKTLLNEAEQGKVQSMYDVARRYERGRGTDINLGEAVKWYNRAAGANHASSKARLGKLYLEGRGVTRDLDKAMNLILQAARENVPSAQYQAAIMYEQGLGTSQDLGKAVFWYKKAAENGYYQAERKIKQLEARGTLARPTTTVRTSSKGLLNTLLKGNWKRRKNPVGYLPSQICNCNQVANDTLECISTEQERNTGSEIISFSTESIIKHKAGINFVVEYSNNVLAVELDKETTPGLGEENEEAPGTTTIKTGKQHKVHTLSCKLENDKSITCTKNKTRTLRFKS